LLAGTATIPYVAYHFHRISPYGVIANLMAMPVVSAWVMPAGILGLISMPLGFDGLWWRLMGQGIDWMISVALWVTSFPGALGRMAAFGTGPLLLCTAGLAVLCFCLAGRGRHCADDSGAPARCADRRRRQRRRHPW
jgi:competence protein ComEC